MTNVGKDCPACTGARKQGTCTNTRSIKRGELETLILNGLRERLMAPELVADVITAFQVEWKRLIAEQGAERAAKERELAAVQKKLTKLIDAIFQGYRAAGLQQSMDELETRKARLTEALAAPAPSPPALHPNLEVEPSSVITFTALSGPARATFVWSIGPRRISPAQTVADGEDDATQHALVVHMRNASAPQDHPSLHGSKSHSRS